MLKLITFEKPISRCIFTDRNSVLNQLNITLPDTKCTGMYWLGSKIGTSDNELVLQTFAVWGRNNTKILHLT